MLLRLSSAHNRTSHSLRLNDFDIHCFSNISTNFISFVTELKLVTTKKPSELQRKIVSSKEKSER